MELEVARMLLPRWDPVGAVSLDSEPEREYLYEAAQIVAQLRAGTDRADLITYLTTTRARLSSVADRLGDQATAESILDWWATGPV